MGSWNEEKFRIRNIQTFQILGLHSTAGSSSPKVASVAPHGPKLESWGTLGKPGRMRECFWILSKPLGLTKLKTYFAVWTCLDMSSTQKLSNCRESGLVECHTIYIYITYIQPMYVYLGQFCCAQSKNAIRSGSHNSTQSPPSSGSLWNLAATWSEGTCPSEISMSQGKYDMSMSHVHSGIMARLQTHGIILHFQF